MGPVNILLEFLTFPVFQAADLHWLEVAGVVLALAILWMILRSILRLAQRVVALGCFVILLLGAVLLFLQYYS
jgi:hypothetical protein